MYKVFAAFKECIDYRIWMGLGKGRKPEIPIGGVYVGKNQEYQYFLFLFALDFFCSSRAIKITVLGWNSTAEYRMRTTYSTECRINSPGVLYKVFANGSYLSGGFSWQCANTVLSAPNNCSVLSLEAEIGSSSDLYTE